RARGTDRVRTPRPGSVPPSKKRGRGINGSHRRRTWQDVCETAKAVSGSTWTTTSALTVGIWEVWHETGRGGLHPAVLLSSKSLWCQSAGDVCRVALWAWGPLAC